MSNVRTLWSILSPKEKASATKLFAWMILGMATEMLGLGIVVPALAFMVGGMDFATSPAAIRWREWLGNPSHEQVLVTGLAVIAGIYVAKTAVALFITWQHHRFVAELQAELSRRLFSAYVRQPWTFHLQRNSATLIHNLENVSTITEAIGWAAVLVAECLVLGGIAVLLIWYEPLGALGAAFVTGAATLLLDYATRSRLFRLGHLQQEHAGRRLKHMHEGLHGVKESLIRGCQGFLLERFGAASAACASVTAKKAFLSNLPRRWFELVAVLSLCMVVGVMLAEGRSTQAMVPVVGLFAAAAFRILPSVNRLATALHTLQFSTTAVGAVREELGLEREAAAPEADRVPLVFDREIVIEGVSYRYPHGSEDALRQIDLRIPRGGAIGLVGSSGAGKSTLVDVILGLLPPTRGRVMVDDVDIASNVRGWRSMIGYVPQSIYLADDSIRRNVAFGVPDSDIDDGAVRRALQAARLEEFVGSLPREMDASIGERGVRLSGGQRQRIGIARALYHDPAVLVLDEATSSLDLETERQIMEAIETLHGDKTVVVVAHRGSTVARCDVVYQLDGGMLHRASAAADALLG